MNTFPGRTEKIIILFKQLINNAQSTNVLFECYLHLHNYLVIFKTKANYETILLDIMILF